MEKGLVRPPFSYFLTSPLFLFAVSLPFLYQVLREQTVTDEFVKSSSQVVTYLPNGLNINYTLLMEEADQEEVDSDYEEDENDDDYGNANHASKLDRIRLPEISDTEFQKIKDV